MRRAPLVVAALVPPALVTFALWTAVRNEVPAVEAVLSWPLAVVPWTAFIDWRRRETRRLPLFALVSTMFWVYYGLPVFRPLWASEPAYQTASLVPALALSLLGVACLWLGYRFAPLVRPTFRVPDIPESAPRVGYVRAVLALGGLIGLSENLVFVFGEGGRNAVLMLGDFIPLVAFAFLLRRQLAGRGGPVDGAFLIGYAVLRVIAALASGWIGSAVAFGVVLVFVYIDERQRLPVGLLLAVVAYVVVLQPAKNAFREVFWYGGAQGSRLERLGFWAGHCLLYTSPSPRDS